MIPSMVPDGLYDKHDRLLGNESRGIDPLPKNIGRGVYAARSFPPGCGRRAFPSTLSKNDDVDVSNHAAADIASGLKSVSSVNPKLFTDQDLRINASLPRDKNCAGDLNPRIYAVRDFPAFCGRKAASLFASVGTKLEVTPEFVEKKIIEEENLRKDLVRDDLLERYADFHHTGESHQRVRDGLNGIAKELPFLSEALIQPNEVLGSVVDGPRASELHHGPNNSVSNCMAKVIDEAQPNGQETVNDGQENCAKNSKRRIDGSSEYKRNTRKHIAEVRAVNSKKKSLRKHTLDPRMKNTTDETEDLVENILCGTKATEKDLEQTDGCHSSRHGAENKLRMSTGYHVNLPPAPVTLSWKTEGNDILPRTKVREILRVFNAICRKILQEKESNCRETPRRIDLAAADVLKQKIQYTRTEKIIGTVPGIEVGDEFQFRIELNMIGLHRPIQGGIDFMKQGGKSLATSIVASGCYDDDMDDSDVLIYSGQGGNIIGGGKEPEDQKLESGNLALKTSFEEKNPVRVIRGDKVNSADIKVRTYTYDGLYTVQKWWQALGPHGKLVFKFMLVRNPGQPVLPRKIVTKSKKFKVREGLCVQDISNGKETAPICVINTIDDERPLKFKYITSMIYPKSIQLVTGKGCQCIGGCTDGKKCACVKKNGGEIPYNHNGSIVEAKPIIFECGRSCRCPPSCYNRVSQNGIRFQLELFKTERRGWGVRSLNFIPSGSFICEYLGELLEEKEAERRIGNDEYLFDIGNRCDTGLLTDELYNIAPRMHARSAEVVEDGFTIDAYFYGNIGRFINHSCSPNLYAQDVLYDHEDKRVPHIMLFAADNIPPLQELSYHYNYVMDQIRDSNGNIKQKTCFCGTPECVGRMY